MRTIESTTSGFAIDADYSDMLRLSDELRRISRELGDQSILLHSEPLDQDLNGELRRVEKEWSTHRSELQTFLSECADTVTQIVAEYEKTNDSLVRTMAQR